MDKELKRLSRPDLVDIIYELKKRELELQQQVEDLQKKLDDRTLRCKSAGSIAEAALLVNDVMAAAQAAADQYLLSVRETTQDSDLLRQQAQEDADVLRQEAARTLEDAKSQAREILEDAQAQARQTLENAQAEAQKILEDAHSQAQQTLEDVQSQAQKTLEDSRNQAQKTLEDARSQAQQIQPAPLPPVMPAAEEPELFTIPKAQAAADPEVMELPDLLAFLEELERPASASTQMPPLEDDLFPGLTLEPDPEDAFYLEAKALVSDTSMPEYDDFEQEFTGSDPASSPRKGRKLRWIQRGQKM